MISNDQATSERILSAAAQLFAIKGYDGTTTREIARNAGSSLSSIKFHFGSKEDLYQTVLDRTQSVFNALCASVLNEIDEAERHGLLNEDSAWDLIVQLTGSVTEFSFRKDYACEILLINRELLFPNLFLKKIPDPVLGIYRYYEKLFEAYTGEKDAFWAKNLSFSTVSTLFDYGNYAYTLEQVLQCDVQAPQNILRIKTHIKQYLLGSLRSYLNSRRQEALADHTPDHQA
jgi:AcrR family transcriptional regulator